MLNICLFRHFFLYKDKKESENMAGDHNYAIQDFRAAGDPEAFFRNNVDEDPGLYQDDVDEDPAVFFQDNVDEDLGDLYQDHADEDQGYLYQENVDEVLMPVEIIPLLIPVFGSVHVPVPLQSDMDQQRVPSPITSTSGVNVGQFNIQAVSRNLQNARASALCCSTSVLEPESRASTISASVSTESKDTLSRKRRRCLSEDDGPAVGNTPQEAEDRRCSCVPLSQEGTGGRR
ncbi:uncharacterized protein LOC134098470 [Sardina pilchardus]|uniref:uncharacterized protein LOC134098470 n=1 Tax=Sardina pilchardus TaxID=27697 RepID=UPI002E1164D2